MNLLVFVTLAGDWGQSTGNSVKEEEWKVRDGFSLVIFVALAEARALETGAGKDLKVRGSTFSPFFPYQPDSIQQSV